MILLSFGLGGTPPFGGYLNGPVGAFEQKITVLEYLTKHIFPTFFKNSLRFIFIYNDEQ